MPWDFGKFETFATDCARVGLWEFAEEGEAGADAPDAQQMSLVASSAQQKKRGDFWNACPWYEW